MESAMHYWKMHKISGISRIYSERSNRVGRRAKLRGISFLPNWDSISQARPMVDGPWRSHQCTLQSTTPDAIPLPVIRSCWNIACYTNDRVQTSPETRFIKTDDWFVRLGSSRKWDTSHVCLRCLIIGNVTDRSIFLDVKLNWFSRILVM